ncbi:hypothetical protein ACW14X_02490 [Nocardioides sp. YJ-D4]
MALDPENPRLPEWIQGSGEDELLEYIFENEVLDELAASLVANGYFDNEPVLVLPPDRDGRRIVVEGNRRVSTLKVLLQEEIAVAADLEFQLTTAPTADRIRQLRKIPAFEVESRDELGAYLGFRHIGGLRQWSAEAKSRWIHKSVLATAASGSGDPFYDVGRIVGSNARGVRTAYLTRELLRRARVDHDIKTAYVETQRYSVWGLLVGNPRIRDYIHLDQSARDYNQVSGALEEVDYGRVEEIVSDLTPPQGRRISLLADSRDSSQYAEILSNERAHAVLREYEDFQLAVSVLEQGALADRLRDSARALREILIDAGRVDVDERATEAASEVFELARSIRAVLADRHTNP